jgi:hypothetical protein
MTKQRGSIDTRHFSSTLSYGLTRDEFLYRRVEFHRLFQLIEMAARTRFRRAANQWLAASDPQATPPRLKSNPGVAPVQLPSSKVS